MTNRIWYDTEFLQTGHSIDLISWAGIRESDGSELYLVNADAPWSRISNDRFLCSHIVPYLPLVGDGVKGLGNGRFHFEIDRTHPRVQPKSVIADQVREFILDAGPEVRLRAWFGAFDHVLTSWLWGDFSSYPEGVPMWTGDVRQDHDRLGNPDLPEQETGQHDALADARQVRVWDLLLDQYELAAR